MNYGDMFNMLGPSNPEDNTFTNGFGPAPYEPRYTDPGPAMNFDDAFAGFKSSPVLYNIDGYISPYSGNNWGGTTNILQYLDEEARLPSFENKIDPNKIFTSEINGLRALAADQQKIVRMFENRLKESLTEKGKMGLTEEDIEALSALTTARSAITGTYKEQVAIKKNIAELRIKQAQNNNNGSSSAQADGSGGRFGAADVGRSIMDNIFAMPVSAPNTDSMNPVYNAPTMDVDKASSVIDELVPSTNGIVKYEGYNPATFVVIGESGTPEDSEYVTYSNNGDGPIIPDFPVPTTKIVTIDKAANTAYDELGVSYPIKE